jgi:SAM-dependent methyltransferase
MNYEFAYRIGFHPWEDAEEQPQFTEKIAQLFEQEESGHEPPYGPALDLGTGSGIWGVLLAKRGWQVTGVDLVDKALRRARERVQNAGVDMRLVHGDVTALREASVGSDFQLVLDTGTFHGLNSAQRAAMGRAVTAIAADDATALILAWTPKRRGPLPRGASRSEIEAAFPGWTVTDVGPTGFQAPKPVELLMDPDERWYRLRRE